MASKTTINQPNNETKADWYTGLGNALGSVLRYGVTIEQAIDYCATVKGQWPRDDWAAIRNVDPQTVAENVARAQEQINDARLGVNIEEQDNHGRNI